MVHPNKGTLLSLNEENIPTWMDLEVQVTEGPLLCDSPHMRSLEESQSETERQRGEVVPGAGGGGVGVGHQGGCGGAE